MSSRADSISDHKSPTYVRIVIARLRVHEYLSQRLFCLCCHLQQASPTRLLHRLCADDHAWLALAFVIVRPRFEPIRLVCPQIAGGCDCSVPRLLKLPSLSHQGWQAPLRSQCWRSKYKQSFLTQQPASWPVTNLPSLSRSHHTGLVHLKL